jgi:hypothetical protein
MLIYQKLKTNKHVKQEKHHKRENFKGHFLFDFFDMNTNFKTLWTLENFKSTLLKLKTLTLSLKLNQTKLILKQKAS